MKMFKDNNGTEWKVSLPLDTIEQIRDCLGVNLLDATGEAFEKLGRDLLLLGRVLWRICEKQAIERGVSPEDFVEAVAGAPFEAACIAIEEAATDFFHGQRKLLLQRASATTHAVRQRAEKLALAKLTDPALETQLEQAMTDRMEAELKAVLTQLSSATT